MYKNFLIMSLCLSGLMSCNNSEITGPEKEPESILIENETDYLPGMIRIKVTEELAEVLEQQTDGNKMLTRSDVVNDVIHALGAESIQRTFPPAGKFEVRTRKAGLHLWYDVVFDKKMPLTRAVKDFSKIQGVTIVEPRPRIYQIDYGKTVVVNPVTPNPKVFRLMIRAWIYNGIIRTMVQLPVIHEQVVILIFLTPGEIIRQANRMLLFLSLTEVSIMNMKIWRIICG